jgi:chorismate synthase
MSHNTFGHLFRVTTWGESHGPAIGCIVDGCPPGLPLQAADIQTFLDKRRPGQSRFTTQRQEPDAVEILSGVFPDDEGRPVTTGTPISLFISNVDQRSKDYSDIKTKFRPGHADYTYWKKYGIRDFRGGGRSSARETAARVAAGAVARKVIDGVTIRGALVQVGTIKVDRSLWDWDAVDANPFFSPDRRRDRGRGRGRAGRLGRADLRQARSGPRQRHDEHQRGEGRRDRRRHAGSRAHRRGECR